MLQSNRLSALQLYDIDPFPGHPGEHGRASLALYLWFHRMGACHRAKAVTYCDVYPTTLLPMYFWGLFKTWRKEKRHLPVVFYSTMEMWPLDAHQMTDDHVWSQDHKAAMKHMDITASDFCQVSQGGWGCLACWGLDQTDVPLLQGEPRKALQTIDTEGPDCSGRNPLLAIALRCQLILLKDLEVKGESPLPQWKLPYQNLNLSVMRNVD